ncbi:MAG: RluA family pseudouridine synthase [Tissierellia bacterium]|nr:RluA family pseudouridine synthase [Tissierellia bacterium]
MREIIVDRNEHDQRLDRFLKKYLNKASTGFIYKMIRKKNIKVNDKRTSPEYMIQEGDSIKLFLSEETIEKMTEDRSFNVQNFPINIVYEDENIILINKEAGVLSHAVRNQEFEHNIVDTMISYLIEKKEYIPRVEKTFTPSICNRLDRNTTGFIIGAKNYIALKEINRALRMRGVDKFYQTIVRGNFKGEKTYQSFIEREGKKNRMVISDKSAHGRMVETGIKAIKNKNNFTLLEIELITGRTHQIRAQLKKLDLPIVGDRKYGDMITNRMFRNRFELKDQLLHCYRLRFRNLEGELKYLNDLEFIATKPKQFEIIERSIFNG